MSMQKLKPNSKEQQLELFKSSSNNKGEKKIIYFWGYRNHVIFDSLSELPVFENTLPANVSDCTVIIPSFKKLQKYLKLSPKGIIADAAYDADHIRKYIRCSLEAKDFIPIKPRSRKQDIKLTPHNTRVCIAGFEMYPWVKFKDRGRIRRKFVCLVTHSKSIARKHEHRCPVDHPKFSKGGCYAYVRLSS